MMMEKHFATLREWALVIDEASYYEILGVHEASDAESIARAFHRFATAFHPDMHTADIDAARADVTRVFCAGAEAYRVLKDPLLRSRYDQALMRGELRLRPASEEPVPGAWRYQSLEDLCKSPAARHHARRADAYIGSGDLRSARDALQQALAADDYDNGVLEDRLEALALALYATGR